MSASEASLGGLPIASGDVLLNKYRVERVIGQGGTGVVISATDVQLDQRVAIKLLRRALDSDELRTRFEREARAMGKIESEHVALVLDAGALEDGAPYMVMEHLDGRDLACVLKEDGPLPVEHAVDCMIQVCKALAKAHGAGIVHRDLKPANLFLTRREDGAPLVKVVDFGISKILDKKLIESEGDPHEVTHAFTTLGSPRYMAPEQVKSSKDVDGRADLWSVGAVLFQLVTGEHAFEAEGNVQASIAVLTAEPRSLTALAPHAPVGLELVVKRCLTRDVDTRVQTATELGEALRPFASERTKASLARIERVARAEPVRAAPSGADERPSGKNEVATERRLGAARAVGPRSMTLDPASVPTLEAGPEARSRASKLVLAALAASAFVLTFGGIVVVKGALGPSSPGAAAIDSARFVAPPTMILGSAGPLGRVPLDAGGASP